MAENATGRSGSFGQHHRPSPVDRMGVWLSSRALRRLTAGDLPRRVADLGCGYEARLSRPLLASATSVTLLDIALAPDLCVHPSVTPLVGSFDERVVEIPDASIDLALCMSVLEHLRDEAGALAQMRRVLAPGGTLVLNVPTWLGKRALEFSAFRLGFSPREEMDDHKRYYDTRNLWPLLVEAGFMPHGIRCRRHKLGLNLLATCRVDPAPSQTEHS